MLIPTLTLLAATLAPALAPQVPRVKLSASSSEPLAFDWGGKSTDGSAHTLPIVEILFRYTRPGATATAPVVVTVPTAGPIPLGLNTVPMKDALRGVPAGEWDVQVALKDSAGQMSGYSVVMESEVFINPPETPTNLRKPLVGG